MAATGLLLATNFSFIGLYEKLANLVAERFASVGNLPAKFRAWREARSERSRLRKEQREQLKAEQLAARDALKGTLELSPEERIAQFMKDGATATNRRSNRSR